MNIKQLTDSQLIDKTNDLCLEYLKSSHLDLDFFNIEATLDLHYDELRARGLIGYDVSWT